MRENVIPFIGKTINICAINVPFGSFHVFYTVFHNENCFTATGTVADAACIIPFAPDGGG